MKYLIWSMERDMWWKFSEYGYTPNIAQAGHFDEARAIEICENANTTFLFEVMVPVTSMQWMIDEETE